MILAKNSDREPNEAQALVRFPAQDHSEKEVQTTFIKIPQVKSTNEIILSRPFQMWGAEIGANEHNVAIGNEAVFTKIPFAKKNTGLTGMDMIRLALERKDTAAGALELITELIEQYGQDACGGYRDRGMYYHNSFIIADPGESWVLETADRHWAAVKVKGFRSISNGLSIDSQFDLSSRNLIDFAKSKGWIRAGAEFSFREAYSDRFFTYFSKCTARRLMSQRLGENKGSSLNAADAMAILRTHTEGLTDENFDPSKCDMSSLCMHATGITTPSQTTGSMVAELRREKQSTFWFTGTSAPCISIFKPLFMKGTSFMENMAEAPGAMPDASTWWQHEKFHRLALRNYREVVGPLRVDMQGFQEKLCREENELIQKNADIKQLDSFSHRAIEESSAKLSEWTRSAGKVHSLARPAALAYRLYRWKQNRAVKIF